MEVPTPPPSPIDVSWLNNQTFWLALLVIFLVAVFTGPVFRGIVNWIRRMR